MSNRIKFDKAKTKQFQEAYKKAMNEGKDSFIFEEKEVDMKYAYYLLEYITTNTQPK